MHARTWARTRANAEARFLRQRHRRDAGSFGSPLALFPVSEVRWDITRQSLSSSSPTPARPLNPGANSSPVFRACLSLKTTLYCVLAWGQLWLRSSSSSFWYAGQRGSCHLGHGCSR
ncbi:uncharacterized protein LOC129639096 isoform X3 [Bubalus kerabau]|uniref:uncharacterized protein LOC129639096 isoform X3 n=1 Tax=Bubalus carabanensis TaxID=3119969 RepID=UPI00244E7FBE|nr:uncharacterized protein LOC129639096 isoform X3 [Bubalus carabanensis]